MAGTMHFIKTDNTIDSIPFTPEDVALEKLQAAVGGGITLTPVRYNGKTCNMVCNEEGEYIKDKDGEYLMVNPIASAAYGHPIFGNVVILEDCNLS